MVLQTCGLRLSNPTLLASSPMSPLPRIWRMLQRSRNTNHCISMTLIISPFVCAWLSESTLDSRANLLAPTGRQPDRKALWSRVSSVSPVCTQETHSMSKKSMLYSILYILIYMTYLYVFGAACCSFPDPLGHSVPQHSVSRVTAAQNESNPVKGLITYSVKCPRIFSAL